MINRTFTKTVLPDKLQSELQEIADDLIESISYHDDIATVHLLREPTGAEDENITSTVNNHTPSYKAYKIWPMVKNPMPSHMDPSDVNFSLLPLAKKKIYNKGELEKVVYYKSATVGVDGSISYSDPVLETTWSYTRDPIGFAVYVEETAKWYYDDDTLGPHSKTIPHYYDGVDKIKEGKRRRGALIDNLMIPLSEMIITNHTILLRTQNSDPDLMLDATQVNAQIQRGRDFMTDYNNDLSSFVNHADPKILTTITNDTAHSFLNETVPGTTTTIRDYIKSELDIWS